MSDEITVVDATEALEPPPTGAIYAWSSEDDYTEAAVQPDPPATGARSVVAVAILALFAAIAAITAGVVVLLTPTRTDHYDLRPMPLQAAPEPPKAPAPPPAAPPAPKAAPSFVEEPPRIAAPVAPPPAAPPPEQTFTKALRGDKPQTQNNAGLYPTDPPATVDAEAKAMCQDLANGGSLQPYVAGTLAKSPSLAPWQAALAVRQAVGAYCPQYANR
ncbi:MAG: DUF732 domain-containing protein [Mycobacterium sp.]|uniref:DUF732 domain-containing protein n=1 Tax=Mycobacterium sp. TaxID=1785 RepID=UPI003BB64BEB